MPDIFDSSEGTLIENLQFLMDGFNPTKKHNRMFKTKKYQFIIINSKKILKLSLNFKKFLNLLCLEDKKKKLKNKFLLKRKFTFMWDLQKLK